MKVQGVFEAALLRHIQKHVDQRAEEITNWDTDHSCCWGHTLDDSCCCDTSTRIVVDFRVPREVNSNLRLRWEYNGNFYELINMLDRAENDDE